MKLCVDSQGLSVFLPGVCRALSVVARCLQSSLQKKWRSLLAVYSCLLFQEFWSHFPLLVLWSPPSTSIILTVILHCFVLFF